MPRPREADEAGPAWLVQAALIARRFHLEGRSKTEIAEETGLSRFKVARILEQARERGLVRVSVEVPASIDADTSARLQARHGLRRAIVVVPSGTTVQHDLGRVTADLLAETVGPDDVLGLTCSRSVAATTQALTRLAPVPVVQLTGTLAGPDLETGSVESVRRAAAVGGGQAFPLYAPMVLPDAATRDALARQRTITQALSRARDVTVATVSIGAWAPGLSTVHAQMDDSERAEVTRAGAVGEIAARAFDRTGAGVASALDARVLGVTLEQLRTIPEVIGLAWGAARAPAVTAILGSGLVDTFVCDQDLAEAMLAASDEPPAEHARGDRTA